VEVPEGEVEELADEAWHVVADEPVAFAVGEDGAVVKLSLTPCGVECVGEQEGRRAGRHSHGQVDTAAPRQTPEAIARELVMKTTWRDYHYLNLDLVTYVRE